MYTCMHTCIRKLSHFWQFKQKLCRRYQNPQPWLCVSALCSRSFTTKGGKDRDRERERERERDGQRASQQTWHDLIVLNALYWFNIFEVICLVYIQCCGQWTWNQCRMTMRCICARIIRCVHHSHSLYAQTTKTRCLHTWWTLGRSATNFVWFEQCDKHYIHARRKLWETQCMHHESLMVNIPGICTSKMWELWRVSFS